MDVKHRQALKLAIGPQLSNIDGVADVIDGMIADHLGGGGTGKAGTVTADGRVTYADGTRASVLADGSIRN
jgi:hypothetical protein